MNISPRTFLEMYYFISTMKNIGYIKNQLNSENKTFAVRYAPEVSQSKSTETVLTYIADFDQRSLKETNSGEFILTGHCDNRNDFRSFRIDRIESLFLVD